MTQARPPFSTMIQGYWRMLDWQRSSQEHLSFIKECLSLGINTVDHAAVYGRGQCEVEFGKALALDPELKQQLHIISKCGIVGPATSGAYAERTVAHYDSGREQIITSCERSLRAMGLEQLDTLLLHRPDFLMDADEACEAFSALMQAGKVKHFGVSNFSASQFDLLQSRLELPLITNQIEISPLQLAATENGTLDQLQRHRIQPMAWSCLGGGVLFSGESEQACRVNQALTEVAEEIGAKSIDQVAYAFILALPARPIPVIGSGNIERVKSALAALDLSMNREQWYRIWSASMGHGVA